MGNCDQKEKRMKEHINKVLSIMKDTSDIFNEMTDQEIEIIAPFFKQQSLPAESFLFREGEPSTFLCFIISGKVEITKQTDVQAYPIIIGRLSAGSFTGETVLLDKPQTRQVSVSATEDSEVLILSRNDLEHISREYPAIGVKLLKELSRILTIRLLKAIDKITRMY
jgi:CRP-like cAMP-binding protein